MNIIALAIGLCAGMLSGFIGIGGGIVIIPALAFFFKFTQQEAQGTTLAAMVPPIGLLAAYVYYQNGYVNLSVAGLVALGFVLGGFLGAKVVMHLDEALLRRIFGVLLFIISIKMIIGK
ncbi:MAG: sulfite exporter TauE/SafE family protein [bacterium]|nr:sulfite exporter TauE/SafE family protein [bacterium]